MNVVYLFASPTLKGSSVQTKVLNQIKYLNEAGAHCKGIFFSEEVNETLSFSDRVDFMPVGKCNWKYFRPIGQRKLLDRALDKYISEHYNTIDFFFLRYPLASFGLCRITKKYGKKIISEHQSKEIDELLSFRKEHPFGLKPSKFLSWLLYFQIPIWNEQLFGNAFAKNIKAIVSVTKEISEFQKAKGNKNVVTMGNGIDVNFYEVRKAPKVSDNTLKFLFLKGTSTYADWNGLDRLIKSIDLYTEQKNNKYKIELIICGHDIDGEYENRSYIKRLGYKGGSDLNEVFNQVHVGVSTLALFRQNLQEATSLKTREYISRGLPFIYAYEDTDFNDEIKKFTFQFSNDDSLLDMQAVVDFSTKILLNENHPIEMNSIALEIVDFKSKMKKLYNFILSLN